MSGQPSEDDPFARLWDEFLERDMERFRAMHQKARTDAGPSFISGARGIDHWTYDWVRRSTRFTLAEASKIVLGYAERMNQDPADLVRRIRPGLSKQHDECFALLEEDFTGPPANEFSVRPSREALAEVQNYVRQRSERALAALSRGRVDEELKTRTAWYEPITARVGGGQRLLLYLVVIAFILAMWASL